MQYATFFIDRDLYGIPVLLVEEFLRPGRVTAVPLTDPRIEGLINLRGKTATVINLRRCLGKSEPPPGRQRRGKMILLETDAGLTGDAREYGLRSYDDPIVLRVDGVHRIFPFEPASMHPPPAHVAFPFIEGLFRLDTEYVTVLSVPKLIAALIQNEETRP